MKLLVCTGVIGVLLTGCVGAGMEGANIAKDKTIVANNIDKAKQGDAVAQYKVGEALCCSPREETGVFYNTKKSVSWLCKSAKQGHGPAMYKIGKIYSGDTVDGVRLMRRAAMGLAGSSENLAVAYVWLKQAGDNGVEGAADQASSLWEDLSATDRQNATQLLQLGRDATCRWENVIK